MLGFAPIASQPIAAIPAQAGAAVALVDWAEADDSTVASVSAEADGSAVWTEPDDTSNIAATAGDAANGTVAWTEADDTSATAASAAAPGGSATTEQSDANVATGSAAASGTVAWQEADDRAISVSAYPQAYANTLMRQTIVNAAASPLTDAVWCEAAMDDDVSATTLIDNHAVSTSAAMDADAINATASLI